MAPCIWSSAAVPWVAAVLAACARAFACWELSVARRVMDRTDSSEVEVSSSAAACWEAPEATDWLEAAICWDALDTCSTAAATWATASWSASAVALTDSLIRAWSPSKLPCTLARRSRWESFSSTPAASWMGAMVASSVRFTPSTIFLKSPWCLSESARIASRPATAASARAKASATSRLMASMQVLRLFLRVLKSPA